MTTDSVRQEKGDVIYRQDAINAFRDYANYDSNRSNAEWVKRIELVISRLPSAQKKGHWIYDSEAYALGNPYGHYDCDQCGESVPRKTNFCPNCGADMRGEDDG